METRIELQELHNTRDLGGYLSGDGRVVRPKKLIRSGTLYRATAKDLEVLKDDYQMKTVVDFRTAAERCQKPDPAMEGVQFINNPILTEAQMGITRESEDNEKSFLNMLLTYAERIDRNPMAFGEEIYPVLVTHQECISQYRNFFRILLEQEEGAVLWHCTAGKDRVGTGTALLLSALNVDRDTVMKDFMLTNTYIEPETQRMLAMVAQVTSEEKIFRTMRVLNSVEEGYLESVFDTIDRVYGSMDAFLETQLGLTDSLREKLQNKYLTVS